MSPKKWTVLFCATALTLVVALAAFNYVTDPFGAFGDRFFQWFSYDETNNPRVAKTSWLEEHHDEYDSYIIGCSSTSSFPTEELNELFDAKFYNLIMYDADMLDCEKIVDYLLDTKEVKNIILNVYLDNGMTYDEESNPLTKNLHYLVDPDISAFSHYKRYLLADFRYGLAKIRAYFNDTILPQDFDVFDEQTGTYDKRVRDMEPIGSEEAYLEAYPVFADYPDRGPLSLGQTENCMKSVAAIRDRCEEAGVNLVVVAGPVYRDYYDNFDREEVIAFYDALAQVTPYWDFSCSSVSCEMRYFYDATHFRNNVGVMMAARMAGETDLWIPEDFGAYVTAETAAAHVAEGLDATALPREEIQAEVPILMYHNLTDTPQEEGDLTQQQFEAQIRAIAEAGYTAISFEELEAYVMEGAPLPDKPVMITFDDGYLSNYTLAYPVLQQYQMKATIFVIGVSVGKSTYKDTDFEMNPHFSYEQAAEMVASGLISVQSHTYDMHEWPPFEEGDGPFRETILPLEGESEEAYILALTEDIQMSRQLLEEATGETVDVLAYPSGAYTTLSQYVLTENGIHVTLSTEPGINTVLRGLPQTLYCMKRNAVDGADSPEDVLAMLSNES